MIENFVAVARSLQRSKGIPDSEFRVFVGADKRESYDKVGLSYRPNCKSHCISGGPRTVPGCSRDCSETCNRNFCAAIWHRQLLACIATLAHVGL